MAKEIISWCDVDMLDDVKVPGRTVRVQIGLAQPVEVDLCEQHEKQLVEPLRELIEQHGQPTAAVDDLTCPMCSKRYTKKESLAKHIRAKHTEAAVEEPVATHVQRKQCPDCDASFDTPQGLGAHRSRAHGYRKGDDK